MAGDEYITPTEFPASPAQAALDDTNQRLAEALSLGRRVARDFERLTSDQRTRVAAGLAREYRRLSLSIAINANVLEDLSAGRDPTTWDDFPAVNGRKDRRMNKLDGLSGFLFTSAAALAAHETFGPIWSKVGAGALALAAYIVARLTPVKVAPALPPKSVP